jgi:hypothetical protein
MYIWSLHLRCIVPGPSPALPARPKYAMRTLPNKETPSSMLLQPHSSVGSLLFIAPPLSLHRRGERREKLEKKSSERNREKMNGVEGDKKCGVVVGGGAGAGARDGKAAAVSLEALRKRMADFAQERDWEQFHSPRNLLLALVRLLHLLPFLSSHVPSRVVPAAKFVLTISCFVPIDSRVS